MKTKIIDEFLKCGQVLDRQVFELHPTAPGADLLPGAFRHIMIIHDSALNPVQVNETVVGAEYFYPGVTLMILVCGQIPDTQPAHADILDLPHVNELIGSYESSKCSFFALKPLEFSFFLKHFFTCPHKAIRSKRLEKPRKSPIGSLKIFFTQV